MKVTVDGMALVDQALAALRTQMETALKDGRSFSVAVDFPIKEDERESLAKGHRVMRHTGATSIRISIDPPAPEKFPHKQTETKKSTSGARR